MMDKIDKGFTLTEALVTLAIIIILALAAALKFGPYDRFRIDAAARKLASSIRYAQELAMLNPGTFYQVFFNPTSYKYGIRYSTDGTNYNFIKDPFTKEDFTVDFNSGTYKGMCLYINNPAVGCNDYFIFFKDSLGTPYDQSGALPLTDPFSAYVLLIKDQTCTGSQISVEPQTGLVTVFGVDTYTWSGSPCSLAQQGVCCP